MTQSTPKPNKFKAQRTGKYASKAEAKRAEDLKLLERAGEITDLEEQREFVLISKSDHGRAIKYRCDYCYRRDGRFIVEDVKSVFTAKNPVYRLKKRLMAEVYGIEILEVVA